MSQPPVLEQGQPSKLVPMAIYICYLASFLAGITGLVGVILAYVNRGSGPAWLETHFHYQIRTFWIGLLYTLIGFATMIVLIGWLVFLAAAIWLILRCAKGMSWLDRGEPVPDPMTWGVCADALASSRRRRRKGPARPLADLATVAQEVVGDNAGHHCLPDRHGADSDAGVVPPLGDDLRVAAKAVHRATRLQDGGGRLDGEAADDGLAGGDPA